MTQPSASRRIQELPRSGVRETMELALNTEAAVRLDIGDPDFGTPAHIVEAAARAACEGFTHYGPSSGLPSLRERIAAKVAARNGIECTPEQAVVTVGGCGALFATMLALLDPGDEVLVPDPAWPNYVPLVGAAGGVPVRYRLDPAQGFEPDAEEVERHVGPPHEGDRGQLTRQPNGRRLLAPSAGRGAQVDIPPRPLGRVGRVLRRARAGRKIGRAHV